MFRSPPPLVGWPGVLMAARTRRRLTCRAARDIFSPFPRKRRGREFLRMLYSILIYVSEDAVDAMTPAEEADHISRHLKIHEQLKAQGRLGPCVRLMPTKTAKQLRTAEAGAVIDGPFAETKEQLLGFYVVDCANEGEALAVARSLPTVGTIFEVRPVQLFFPGVGLPQTEVERVRS
jgi:hypothetical protein